VGTASLVFGLILIGAGVAIAYNFLTSPSFYTGPDDAVALLLGFAIIVAPLMALGGILLRKYDSDKKKENEPIQNKEPEVSWKYPILKGVIIGIILIVIFWGIYGLALSQTFYMVSDALSPDVMKGDLMHYQRTPFNEIKVGDIIAFIPSDKDEFETKVGIVRIIGTGSYVQTSNNVNPNTLSSVFEKDYVGKITSITSQGWISTVYSTPYYLLIITAVLFVIPIIIMKIREKKSKNS